MSVRDGMLHVFASVTMTLCLLASSQPVSAGGGCRMAKGTESVVNNGNGTTSGTITRGGKLNGSTQSVFTSDFTPTPDPVTFSFSDDLTVTTNEGILQTHNVTLFDTSTGAFTAIARIDSITSTGIFAGATGVLYINGKTTDGGATFQGKISGEICFAG